jgi:hypothetical protein
MSVRPKEIFGSGDRAPYSGIYGVFHDSGCKVRQVEHVTCVCGRKFPVCAGCGSQAKFTLEQLANHPSEHSTFTTAEAKREIAKEELQCWLCLAREAGVSPEELRSILR